MKHRTDDEIESNKAIGVRIKTARLFAMMSQKKLAELLNLERASIIRYESGRLSPSAHSILVIANALSVTAEWLLIGDRATHHRYESMPIDILNDMAAIQHLAIYRSLNDDQRYKVRSFVKELAGENNAT